MNALLRIMPEIAVSALDARQRTLVANARIALEQRNHAYAAEACLQVLGAAPGCLAVRRLLRQAQLEQWRRRPRWERWIRAGVGWLLSFAIRRRTPEQRLRAIDRRLARHPTSVAGLRQLAEAAEVREWHGTVVFALAAVRELAPRNLDHALALSRALLANGEPESALALANDVLAQRLLDPVAQELVRAASVAATMTRGHWDSPGSFREKLKQPTPGEPAAKPAAGSGSHG